MLDRKYQASKVENNLGIKKSWVLGFKNFCGESMVPFLCVPSHFLYCMKNHLWVCVLCLFLHPQEHSMWRMNSQPWDQTWAETKSQVLNCLSHLEPQMITFFKKNITNQSGDRSWPGRAGTGHSRDCCPLRSAAVSNPAAPADFASSFHTLSHITHWRK